MVKPEKSVKNQPKFSGKRALSRRKALRRLNGLIDVATFRLECRYTPNKERLAWGRVLARAIAASGQLLRDSDLDELKERVEALETANR
jgi:hypothetical protein